MEIKEIKENHVEEIIKSRQPQGKFFTFDGVKGMYIAIDNSAAKLRTKEYKNVADCIQWLQGKDETYREGQEYQLQEGKQTLDCIILQEYESYITMREKSKGYPVTIEKYKLLNGQAKLIKKGEDEVARVKKDPEVYEKVKELAQNTDMTARQIMKETGVSWSTAQNYIGKYRESQDKAESEKNVEVEDIKKQEAQKIAEEQNQEEKEEKDTVLQKIFIGKLTGTHYSIKKNGIIIEEGFHNALICKDTLGAIIQELEEIKKMIS
ncbi:hypothetical protein CACET_c31940 [Clostridium aceticum]|uniref:Uncharacterized protein n=1 Tax=Clostridium aceticum TaxID=84022 RepID=A0A0D8I740_9CLOT|nr:hypothetical protein [Clostridium aceticum]AKL96638.1 hypothetical protein CACET_c31940 [Clostridium aceticum]KJF26063.1 hypothetical protein TZ02_15165 [Clostridium aceticum]